MNRSESKERQLWIGSEWNTKVRKSLKIKHDSLSDLHVGLVHVYFHGE